MKFKQSGIEVIREDIKALSAYHVQDSANMIKLDAMENPFRLPDSIYKKWLDNLETVFFNRYPDSNARNLELQLREILVLDNEFDILFGNGSDELIQIVMTAVAKPSAKVLAVNPSFVMYGYIAQLCNLEYLSVDLKDNFSLDFEKLQYVISTEQPELIFIAQPNNPTANLFDTSELCELINISKGLFILDEAYTDFTDFDGLDLINKYENLIVMRTFSKTGLAGLRLGYLIGRKDIVTQFNKVRLPYNINSLTQSLASVVLENFDELKAQTEHIRQLRSQVVYELQKITSVTVLPSETNFIVVRLLNDSANEIHGALKREGILIKNLHGSHPLLQNCLRITIGSESENQTFLNNFQKLLKT